MEIMVVDCSGCKARLKIKVPPGRILNEIKCPKCGVKNAAPKGGASAQESKAPATSVQTPAGGPPPVPAAPPVTPPAAPPPVQKAATPPPPLPTSAGAAEAGTVSVTCDACQWQTRVPQAFMGKKIRCRECSAVILVGSGVVASAPAAPVPPAPATLSKSAPVRTAGPLSPVPPTPATLSKSILVRTDSALLPAPGEPIQAVPSPAHDSKPVALSAPSSATQALKVELENVKARMQSLEEQAKEADRRAQHAEQRMQESDRAFRDLAGKHALELMASHRKTEEQERELEDYRTFAFKIATDYEEEIAKAEKRIAVLRDRLTRFTS